MDSRIVSLAPYAIRLFQKFHHRGVYELSSRILQPRESLALLAIHNKFLLATVRLNQKLRSSFFKPTYQLSCMMIDPFSMQFQRGHRTLCLLNPLFAWVGPVVKCKQCQRHKHLNTNDIQAQGLHKLKQGH